jgi:hypothetical protein
MPDHPTPADILHHVLCAVADFDEAEMRAGRKPTHALTAQIVRHGIKRANEAHQERA